MTRSNSTTEAPTPTHIFFLHTGANLRNFPRVLPHNPDTIAQKKAMAVTSPGISPVHDMPTSTLHVVPGVNFLSAADAQAFRLDRILRDVPALKLFAPLQCDDHTAIAWVERSACRDALAHWRSLETRAEVNAALDARLAHLNSLPATIIKSPDHVRFGGITFDGLHRAPMEAVPS